MNQRVSVYTNDGRHVVGVLKGYDKQTNLLLSSTEERVYSETDPVETVELGFLLLRGDNCAMIGLLNATKDRSIDPNSTLAAPMKPIVHS